MKMFEEFKKNFRLICVLLGSYLVLHYGISLLGLNDYYLGDGEYDKFKFTVSTILFMIPSFILWFFISKNDQNKLHGVIGVLIHNFMNLWILGTVLIYGFPSELFDSGWWLTFATPLSFTVYGLLKYKNSRAFYFFLFGLVYLGIGHAARSFYYVDGIHDLYRLITFRGTGLWFDSYDYAQYIYQLFSAARAFTIILLFFMFKRFVENPNSFSIHGKKFELESVRLNKVEFSVIFWLMRILIISVLLIDGSLLKYALREEGFNLEILFHMLKLTVGVFYLLAIYRHILLQYNIQNNKFPSWQYLGLSIPIINIFVWIFLLASKTKEPEELDSEIEAPNIERIKKAFIKDGKNGGIKNLIVILYLLVLLIFSFTGIHQGNIGVIAFAVIQIAISVAILAWYIYSEYVQIALIIILTLSPFLILVMDGNTALEWNIYGSMINIVVYHVLFHFDKYEFIEEVEKKEEE